MIKTVKVKKQMRLDEPNYKTRVYQCWENMKRRCLEEKHKHYKNYGGRGITVCEEWLSDFSVFKEWALSNGYSDELTLDRIDNDGDYTPDNCQWSTYKAQQNNRRNNRKETLGNETKNVSEWAELYQIDAKHLYQRLDRGMTLKEALEVPVIPKLKMQIKDLGKRIKSHRKELGLTQNEYGLQVGTDKSSVSLWEKDGSNPGLKKLEALVLDFGLDVTGLKYVDGSELELIRESDSDEQCKQSIQRTYKRSDTQLFSR